MQLKSGVIVTRIQPELMLALFIASGVWLEYGEELVVTSINDSVHGIASLHYAGQAADLRTRYFEKPEIVAEKLRKALGHNQDYDIVVESDHIHLEWQPKRRGT